MNDAATRSLDELHDEYVEQVNLAVAEDRDDIVDALSARFAAAIVPRPPTGGQAAGPDSAGADGSRGERDHGPLPLLLVGLTIVTGLVDAFSYLSLGHVFVANMTGNVIFLGFGLAGVGGISIVASVLAVLAFALGATVGGRWAAGQVVHRGHLLAAATVVQAGLVLVAAVIASTAGAQGSPARLTLVGLLAVAMGGQNALVRRLAVPDLTTTVLTLTVTGLVADTTPPSVRARRLVSILSMLVGALTGGVLLRWAAPAAPLWLAATMLGACAAAAYAATRRPQSQAWR